MAVALLFMGSAFPPDRPCSWWPVGVSKPWRQVSHHWSPLKKRVSQKIMLCVSWCFTQCVFLFLGSAPCTTLFTLSQNSIGILTEAIHLYTSDKISIFLCFFSLVFSLVFWGKRLCENKTLHIYWTEPPWKELRTIWKSAQYQRFYSCCLHGALFNMDLCCY